MRAMKGGWKNGCRLRVGSYRSILQLTNIQLDEVIYVDFIGQRGDACSGAHAHT